MTLKGCTRQLRLRLSQQEGESLISLVVSIAFSLLVLSLVGRELIRWKNFQAHLDLEAKKVALRRYLIESVACSLDLNKAGCPAGALTELKDRKGNILISMNPTTKYGEWTLRASCADSMIVTTGTGTSTGTKVLVPNKFAVQVAKFDANGVSKDPHTEEILDFTQPKNTILKYGEVCGRLLPPGNATSLRGKKCFVGKITLGPYCEVPTYKKRMCCEDGSNSPSPKPTCPKGTMEVSAVWDRQDDLGRNGQWVVTCR